MFSRYRIFEKGDVAVALGESRRAAVLGCTEIPLIVRPEEAPLPTLDSTRLLAKAAVARAIRGGSRREAGDTITFG